jgi:serine/threonine protein kinase
VVQTIGGYEVRGELGRGGMGVVYRGFDNKLEREVAIKVIENVGENADMLTQTSHQELVERFRTEAKAIAKLSHPNIVSIFDFGVEQDKNYMVMELLKGRDLSQLLKFNSPLSIELVIKCIIHVCAALDYAHQTGIIHRDIKPANMILLDNGITKLMDFGIARIQESQSQLTQAGTILGSVLYISPEQLISAQKVDKRADIYSLGISMYELLTGKFPYDGDNVASIISKIMSSQPEPPSIFNPKISPELDEIVLHTIEKNPDNRFQRASELGEALSEVLYKLKGGNTADPLRGTSSGAVTPSSSSAVSKTSYARAMEISLVEGVDKINLYSLIYRVIQTWSVENIGNKPLLEAIYKNENLSQAIVVSDKVILLVYKGLVIGAVSSDPDHIGSGAYEVTAEITRVDIKACIPSESQQEYLVVLSSILGSGFLLAKHPACNSNDLENLHEKAKEESFTGHMEIIDATEIKYKGFVDGREIFTLIYPNKNPNSKTNKMDIEVYEAKLKLYGPSLRRALIDTTLEVISKTHGSSSSFKQLSLQRVNKIIPELVEEAIRNTDIATLTSNDKVISIGKQSTKYSAIIEDFSAYTLVKWLIKDLLIKIARAKNFDSLKNIFSWIWNLKTVKLSQTIKLQEGKPVSFDLIAYDNSEKLSVVARYSSQGSVSEIQNFLNDVSRLKKGLPNSDIKAAVYISGDEFYPEVVKFYDKIAKRQSILSFSGPRTFIGNGGFHFFMVRESYTGYHLVAPQLFQN